MRLLRPALFSMILATTALPALAQPGGALSAEAEERRTRLFKEGKAAADAGEWREAAEKFRQVVALRSAPKALIALGVAEEHNGRLVAAHAAYKQAREGAADKALTDELKTANAALDAIRPRIPQVTLTPSDALVGAEVQLDGQAAELSRGVLLVDPGEHKIKVVAPGKGDFNATVRLKEGDQREVNVVFGQQTAPDPTASSTTTGDVPSGGGVPRPPAGAVVVGSLGVVAVGVGAALFAVGSSQYGDALKQCPASNCPPDVAARGNAGRTQIIVGDVLMGAGAAAVVGAGIWWIVSAKSAKKPEETSVFIAPRIGGVTVGGRF